MCFFQAEDGIREAHEWLDFRRVLFRSPLLVVQGANDPRVNKAESDQIVVALRNLGRDVEYLVAPDEGHGFAGELNNLATFAKEIGRASCRDRVCQEV